ncbi:Transcriptional regulator PadR-like family protein [Evansella caseinilytica]|uniref:Transcriptional regulator PadR-like family protein n=1 Tax=Evansella caseinilytica TaxID=1503961 RepID=A0A1H3RB35_9BACI|nr:PadR family transcriptional regulator [Evansella caseinilytica]SDZ22733.1 Transcriptional regulator PadR-like family protein [Evansella caseinilytica]
MEKKLARLKKSMTKHVFKDLSFSAEHQNAVRERLQRRYPFISYSDNTLWTIFTSIEHHPKHGFDILQILFHKGDMTFHRQEGYLYTLLHTFESRGFIKGEWSREKDKWKKYYFLTNKGKKALHKAAQKQKAPSLKNILEGGLAET